MYQLLTGDNRQILRALPDQSVHCIVTSPPYFGLRDYGTDGQIGLEETPEQYVAELVAVFRECWRVLRDDGTLWCNLGDSYARQAGDDSTKPTDSGLKTGRTGRSDQLFKSGNNRPLPGLKPKDLIGIPWRVAFALQADGWYLRSDIIWHKPNPMPESVTDRPTKSHEYIFLLTKSQRYYYDAEAVKEPGSDNSHGGNVSGKEGTKNFETHGKHRADKLRNTTLGPSSAQRGSNTRNRRSVWTVATAPYAGAHFATFPPALIEPCILAGCPVGGVVLDPFNGSGTTGAVACAHNRNYIGIDLNPDYIELAHARIREAINESGRARIQPICRVSDFSEMPLFAKGD